MAPGGVNELFFGLTPDRVLAAVEAADLSTRPVCYPLNSFENRVYEVELEDRSRVIAKFYRPGRWSAEQILEEHRFLDEAREAEIPVCEVQPFPDGTTLKQIDHVFYSLSPRRGGRAPDELSDAQAARLGMMVGRLHNVGASRPAPSRPPLDADHYVRQPVHWLRQERLLPPTVETRFAKAADEIADIADRRAEGVETHRIHADLHLGNVLFRDGELRLLDFDDLATGPAVQDLWLAVDTSDEPGLRRRDLWLQGYEHFRLFDRGSLFLVEPLRGLRMIHFAAWLARRRDDPAFRIAWPDLETAEFWHRQTEDVEEQLERILRQSRTEVVTGSSASGPILEQEEALLTNKDYFWDWEGD